MKITLFDDFEVEMDPRTEAMGKWWKEKKAQDPNLLEFFYGQMQRFEKPIVLDIGAHIGTFSLLAKFHPGAFIYAYEPAPDTLDILINNIELNGLKMRVGVMPFALSNKDGRAILKVPLKPKRSGLACLGNPLRFGRWTEVEVRVRRLDRFSWPNGLDLIKIDVEGAEILVLQGGEETIKEHRPGILMEYQKANTQQFRYRPGRLVELLKSYGYTHFEMISGRDMWATT